MISELCMNQTHTLFCIKCTWLINSSDWKTFFFVQFLFVNSRAFSTSTIRRQEGGEGGWLKKVFVRKIEPTKESHSRVLSDKEVIYELHTHNVRPDSLGQYLQN